MLAATDVGLMMERWPAHSRAGARLATGQSCLQFEEQEGCRLSACQKGSATVRLKWCMLASSATRVVAP